MLVGNTHLSLLMLFTVHSLPLNYTRQDVLNPQDYHGYIKRFNSEDDELYQQHIPNQESWNFLEKNIPLFDCPDKELEVTYYFRWWTYRKHIKKVDAVHTSTTGVGNILKYVITEFLPNVSWSGKFNTISAAAAHHIKGSLHLNTILINTIFISSFMFLILLNWSTRHLPCTILIFSISK